MSKSTSLMNLRDGHKPTTLNGWHSYRHVVISLGTGTGTGIDPLVHGVPSHRATQRRATLMDRHRPRAMGSAIVAPACTIAVAPTHRHACQRNELNSVPSSSFAIGRSLTGKKKCSGTSFPKKPAGTPCAQPWLVAVGSWRLAAVGGWQLAVGDWWLVAVGGGWRRLVVGDWWLVVGGGWQWLAVGGWSPLAVGGGWWLAAGGGWWLAVGGWWSLGAVLEGGP